MEDSDLGPYDTRPWPPLDEHGKPTDPCPYPGLMALSERFAPVYFGRDPETAEVLAELNKMRDRGDHINAETPMGANLIANGDVSSLGTLDRGKLSSYQIGLNIEIA